MGPQWKSSWPSPAAITELRFCVFAGRADAEVYRTLKISSGRGSKCSGKKIKHGLENQGILHEIYTAATELL